jgi:hypothetical protein
VEGSLFRHLIPAGRCSPIGWKSVLPVVEGSLFRQGGFQPRLCAGMAAWYAGRGVVGGSRVFSEIGACRTVEGALFHPGSGKGEFVGAA